MSDGYKARTYVCNVTADVCVSFKIITSPTSPPSLPPPSPPPMTRSFLRADAAEEILDSMESEGVEPDARCYRFAATAFRGADEDVEYFSAEADRLTALAADMEASDARNSVKGEGDGVVDGLAGGLGLSGTSGLQTILEGAADNGLLGANEM